MKNEFRALLIKCVLTLLFSLMLFGPFNVKYVLYVIISAILWGMLMGCYDRKRNLPLYREMTVISVGNFLALVLAKGLVHHTLHVDLLNMVLCILYLLFLLWIMTSCRMQNIQKQEMAQTKNMQGKQLFPKRVYDLERIVEYVDKFEITGVNGAWGSGKSFLMEHLKQNSVIKDKYEIIEIDLLSCKLDEIQVILLSAMDHVLQKNKIFSRHSGRLKRMLGEEKFLSAVRSLLFADDQVFSNALNGFKEELEHLEKNILVIYEDIDRIDNAEIVKKIFAISEKLSGQRIKVLYQYEEANLKEMGLDRNYLEKYIPYVVNLTELQLFEMLELMMGERAVSPEVLTLDDFGFFRFAVYTDKKVAEILRIAVEFKLRIENLTIRKVEHFLNELMHTLESNTEYQKEENKRTVINFLLLKHFNVPYYEKLRQGERLTDCLKFADTNETYTIFELLKLRESQDGSPPSLTDEVIRRMFEKQENLDTYVILSMFNYRFCEYEVERKREAIENEPLRNIQGNNDNHKIDRIIWNLLSNGKSEYTDYEENARELIREVFSKPEDEWKAAYRVYTNTAFHGKYQKRDNETIMRWGIRQYIPLFQAFRVYGAGKDEWLKLIKLYFMLETHPYISVEFIEMVNYCDLEIRAVCLEVLKRFSNMQIRGNLNGFACYRKFLKEYMQSAMNYGGVCSVDIWQIEGKGGIEDRREIVEHFLEQCLNELRQSEKELDIPVFRADAAVIENFIEKNLKLIRTEKKLARQEWKAETHMSARWKHQEKMDGLLAGNLPKEQLLSELECAYKEETLDPHEIKVILREYNDKQKE